MAFKYFAFISYSSKDARWGFRLQRKLESFRLSATICQRTGLGRKPMNPVFFAPSDIQPGSLSDELKSRLASSKNLIVLCSPNSARSQWVGREIEYFHSLGREKDIFFFIVDGAPASGNAETDCFNPILQRLGIPEPLAPNIRERNYRLPWLNRERAYIQLISKLLGVEFDTIWNRQRRALVRKFALFALALVAVCCAMAYIWRLGKPFDAHVRLEEAWHNSNLPRSEAFVSISLDKEVRTDSVGIGDFAVFYDIPRRYHGMDVRMRFAADNYNTLDTVVRLSDSMSVKLVRNPAVFGDIRFRIYNPREEMYVGDAVVKVHGRTVSCGADGVYRLFIPQGQQRTCYLVESDIKLINDTVYMPAGDKAVLLVDE